MDTCCQIGVRRIALTSACCTCDPGFKDCRLCAGGADRPLPSCCGRVTTSRTDYTCTGCSAVDATVSRRALWAHLTSLSRASLWFGQAPNRPRRARWSAGLLETSLAPPKNIRSASQVGATQVGGSPGGDLGERSGTTRRWRTCRPRVVEKATLSPEIMCMEALGCNGTTGAGPGTGCTSCVCIVGRLPEVLGRSLWHTV